MSKFGGFITICLFVMMIFLSFLTNDKKDNVTELNTKETI